jgi:uncharacterized protein YndB with AHSA1/START domain
MRAFEAASFIAAAPEDVWGVLTDAAAWPGWDSGVTSVAGRLAIGEKVTIKVQANPGRAFPVTVTALERPARMVFRGGMPLRLFTGERTYTLIGERGGTAFAMREVYSGPLAALIFRSIPDLGPSFRQFAEGLKQRVEGQPAS